ncbi:MAG TPA: TM2 domain-containing protein [Tepidisphaeraceae bacterium]|jgi:TM2 domain-containing membrane protein YozV
MSQVPGTPLPTSPAPFNPAESKRVLCGILAIVLGGLAIHKFIMGKTSTGIIQIIVSFATCGIGSIIGLIEGIMYLTKTDEQFYNEYIVGGKNWF